MQLEAQVVWHATPMLRLGSNFVGHGGLVSINNQDSKAPTNILMHAHKD